MCLQCCGPARSCSLQGFDRQARQVFLFERPLRVDACCLGCCLMEMRVYTPQRQLLGSVRQRYVYSEINLQPLPLSQNISHIYPYPHSLQNQNAVQRTTKRVFVNVQIVPPFQTVSSFWGLMNTTQDCK